jgi:hypothetical protein
MGVTGSPAGTRVQSQVQKRGVAHQWNGWSLASLEVNEVDGGDGDDDGVKNSISR